MKTLLLNKPKIKSLKLQKNPREVISRGTMEHKLIPGKSLEQIRLDAVRQLREMGIFI